jgi:uncharacterized protein YcbX
MMSLPQDRSLLVGAAAAAAIGIATAAWFFSKAAPPSGTAERAVTRPPDATTSSATVSQLYVFPVKSCSGSAVSRVELVETGVRFDREWAVVSAASGKVLTQRDTPKMRLVSALVDDGKFLRLTNNNNSNAVGGGTGDAARMFSVDIEATAREMAAYRKSGGGGDAARSRMLAVVLWGIPGTLWDEGDDVAAWLSAALGVPCRLGRIFQHRRPMSSTNHAPVVQQQDVVSMQDFSSLHVISQEAIDWVNAQLQKQSAGDATAPAAAAAAAPAREAVDALRFRPNVVVRGVPFPEDDLWKAYSIGGVPIRVAKHCGRCSIPTILSDGSRDEGYQPTAMLKRQRNAFYTHQVAMDFESKQPWPQLGANVFHTMPPVERGTPLGQRPAVFISVGDRVEVTEWFTGASERLRFVEGDK